MLVLRIFSGRGLFHSLYGVSACSRLGSGYLVPFYHSCWVNISFRWSTHVTAAFQQTHLTALAWRVPSMIQCTRWSATESDNNTIILSWLITPKSTPRRHAWLTMLTAGATMAQDQSHRLPQQMYLNSIDAIRQGIQYSLRHGRDNEVWFEFTLQKRGRLCL